jgi:hypothetical protein
MAWEVRGSPNQRIKHHVIVSRDDTVTKRGKSNSDFEGVNFAAGTGQPMAARAASNTDSEAVKLHEGAGQRAARLQPPAQAASNNDSEAVKRDEGGGQVADRPQPPAQGPVKKTEIFLEEEILNDDYYL